MGDVSLGAIFSVSGIVWPEADRLVMRAGRPTPRDDRDWKLAHAQECDPENRSREIAVPRFSLSWGHRRRRLKIEAPDGVNTLREYARSTQCAGPASSYGPERTRPLRYGRRGRRTRALGKRAKLALFIERLANGPRLTEHCGSLRAVRDPSADGRENRLPGLAPRSSPGGRPRKPFTGPGPAKQLAAKTVYRAWPCAK